MVDKNGWLHDNWKCPIVHATMVVEGSGYLTNPELEKQKVDSAINEQ
jgi:hypothetical protein